MTVRGLDGREYKLKLSGKHARPVVSSGHKEARELLLGLYPFDPAYEEVHLPGCGPALYFDFILPLRRLAVEVQGEQHRKYVQHFHGSTLKFLKQVARDNKKVEWASLNGFILIALRDDKREDWADQLRNAFVA